MAGNKRYASLIPTWLQEFEKEAGYMDKGLLTEIGILILKGLKQAIGFGEYKTGHWEHMTEKEKQTYLNIAAPILAKIREVVEGVPNWNESANAERMRSDILKAIS